MSLCDCGLKLSILKIHNLLRDDHNDTLVDLVYQKHIEDFKVTNSRHFVYILSLSLSLSLYIY